MRDLCRAAMVLSLCGPMLGTSAEAAEVSGPRSDKVALEQLVQARLVDYRARLDALFQQRLDAWERSFIASRRAAFKKAGTALAAEAASIRSQRREDWTAVGEDPQFRAFEQAQVESLLEPRRLRSELTLWAKGVEQESRDIMVELFRQLIAEDLGQRFDAQLRGKVVRAVCDIPLEKLVKADASWIERRIRSGLPSATLTSSQRTAISAAASALAAAAAGLAAATYAPMLVGKIAALATLVGHWLADLTLEVVDRRLSGEPDPAILASHLEGALKEWQKRELRGRLENILNQFGEQLIDMIEGQAHQTLGRPPA